MTALLASLAPTTRAAYARVLSRLQEFAVRRQPGSIWFPAPVPLLVYFIASLIVEGRSPSSIQSSLSAISYFHKLFAVFDPTTNFLVKKMVAGIHKLKPQVDLRAPITPAILVSLCAALDNLHLSAYIALTFKSIFTLMFHGFLRIGEVTDSPHSLQFENICISDTAVNINFSSFKHHTGTPFSLRIASGTDPCPVKLLNAYVSARGQLSGPLFILSNGAPISSQYFYQVFYCAVSFCKLSSNIYKPHSFRIGAATHAFVLGKSEQDIQRMGRWHSSAFSKYIRVDSFSV
jgi:site-specific recombinase XerC